MDTLFISHGGWYFTSELSKTSLFLTINNDYSQRVTKEKPGAVCRRVLFIAEPDLSAFRNF